LLAKSLEILRTFCQDRDQNIIFVCETLETMQDLGLGNYITDYSFSNCFVTSAAEGGYVSVSVYIGLSVCIGDNS